MSKNNGSETTVIRDNEMLKDSCTIRLEECTKLMQPRETRDHNTQLRIEFNGLRYSVSQKDTQKVILCNVTGHFNSGKLTVLIGPSGAGKTTLLKIILGELLLNVEGTVTMNGNERNKGMFRKQMCYVPQVFALLPYLTTRETLYIAARLKLGANQTRDTIHLIVDETVEKLGLCNCRDTLAKNLSGGERKRLLIGQEMIIKPTVLLLDEPTSGLDSLASNQLINVLHTMAKANCTVICAIHQPTSQMIMQFDDILVLNQGKCVYCGPQSEIMNTFSNAGFVCPQFYNIAEFGNTGFIDPT